MSIVFSFFVLILPFVLWQLSRIGGSIVSLPTEAGFPPSYVPGPIPTWVSIASLVEKVESGRGHEIQQELASFLKGASVNKDHMAVQSKIISIAEWCLARFVERIAPEYVAINVDYNHINAVSITLSSDQVTSNSLGQPNPVRHAGTGSPAAIHFYKRDKDNAHVLAIRLTKWCPRGVVFINGLRIDRITVEDGFAANVNFTNCWIKHVSIHTNSSNHKPNLNFKNTRVRLLQLHPNCCSDMTLRNSYVRHITCTPPELGNPFVGSLVLSGDVSLGERKMPEKDIQNYRNLRHNLSDRRHSWAVYVIRAIELSAERNYDTNMLTKTFNYLYDFSSGYGNVPERALSIATTLIAYNVLLVWLNKLHVVVMDCTTANPSAWITALCRGDAASSLLASLLLVLQGLL